MKIGLIICVVVCFWACKKSTGDLFIFQKGEFTGGLGCSSWLILKEDNRLLKPTNLDSFNISPKSDMRVLFSYYPDTVGTTCEVNTIHLMSISELRN